MILKSFHVSLHEAIKVQSCIDHYQARYVVSWYQYSTHKVLNRSVKVEVGHALTRGAFVRRLADTRLSTEI